jgi:hypothetical protein
MSTVAKPYTELLAFLTECGTNTTKHSHKSLLAHLEGVYALLLAAGQDQDVCNAGLFHSIYGTSNFKTKTLSFDQRDLVRSLIGSRAEAIAFLFCRLDRPTAFIQHVAIDILTEYPVYGGGTMVPADEGLGQHINDLLTVEAANLLEQQVLWRNHWLIPHAITARLVSKAGDSVVSSNNATAFEGMLETAKKALFEELILAINKIRQNTGSYYWQGEELRALKLDEAQLIASQADDHLNLADIPLLSNYSIANKRPLKEVALEVLSHALQRNKLLTDTEIAKDTLSANIRFAQNFDDISVVRKAILTLTTTFAKE